MPCEYASKNMKCPTMVKSKNHYWSISDLFLWSLHSSRVLIKQNDNKNKIFLYGYFDYILSSKTIMIAFLQGTVEALFPNTCFLNVHGVGYRLTITETLAAQLTLGQNVTIYTYLDVREDALVLYGFANSDENDLFCQLLTVNGIGPKAALKLLSHLQYEPLIQAIQSQNIKILSSVPGIGKKIAQRIALELKDKLPDIICPSPDKPVQPITNNLNDAKEALLFYGYSQNEIQATLAKITDTSDTAQIIKTALKMLSPL